MPFHESFDSTVQKSQIWLKEIQEMAGLENEHQALLALRAVLHSLRDRLTVNEAVDVAAQLPMLIRGLYYEGWTPSGKPIKERHKEQFLDNVRSFFTKNPDVDAELISRAVFKYLSMRITAGEIADIRQMMPPELRELLPELVASSR
jgi:uncharacterized protein (DUF2267 family)